MDVTMTKDGNMTVIDIKNVDETEFEKVWGTFKETIDKNETKEADKETVTGEEIKKAVNHGIDDYCFDYMPEKTFEGLKEREMLNPNSIADGMDGKNTLEAIAKKRIDNDKEYKPYYGMVMAAFIACEFMWTQSKEKEATVTGEELADMMRISIRDFYNAWQGDAGNPQPWKADDREKDRGFYNVAYDFISDVEEYPVYSAIKMAASIACEYMCRKMNNG